MDITTKDIFLLSNNPDVVHEIISRVAGHYFLSTFPIKLENSNGIKHLKMILIKLEELPYGFARNLVLKDIKKMSCSNKVVVH